MKKALAIFGALMTLTMMLLAQGPYPYKTIRELQEVPIDTLDDPPPADASPYLGDTVWVRGVVASKVRIDDGRYQWFTGNRIRFVLVDPADTVFNYITVVAGVGTAGNDTTFFNTTGIDLLVPGDSIEVRGYISEFRSLTQLQVIPAMDCFNLLGISSYVDSAKVLPLNYFFNGTTVNRNPGEMYESGFVRFNNLTVVSTNGADFTMVDGAGNQIQADDQSNQIFGTTPPASGSKLDFVQGYIFTLSGNNWSIAPRTPNDYKISSGSPVISQVARLDTFPTSTDSVVVKAKITSGFPITSAQLVYSVNGTHAGNVALTTSDSIYYGTIPAIGIDSAVVAYYIIATNGENLTSVSPVDTGNTRYFYVTHDRPLMIQDIQFTPYRGASSYVNGYVTVEGIVTSDRKDYSAVHIQNGTGPWSGIRIIAKADSSLKRGDHITANGYVRESFNLTVLDTVTFTIHSSNNPLPEATKVIANNVRTSGLQGEMYEGVLVRVDSVYVVALNEDASSNQNFGEFGVLEDSSKTSGLRVDDFNPNRLPYTNDTSRTKGKIQLHRGDFFEAIIGLLDFSFSNYKILPRDSADFIGYRAAGTTSVERISNVLPNEYELKQNYPNPFNPSTKIVYSLKAASPVELKVFNILGQEVATLVHQMQPLGTYEVSFNASTLSSGVYFYKLQAGNFVSIKKMIFIK